MFNRKKKETEHITAQYLADQQAQRDAMKEQVAAIEEEMRSYRTTLDQYQTELAELPAKIKELQGQIKLRGSRLNRIDRLLELTPAELYNDQLNDAYQQAVSENSFLSSSYAVSDYAMDPKYGNIKKVEAEAALRNDLSVEKVSKQVLQYEAKTALKASEAKLIFLEAAIPRQMEYIRETNKRLIQLDQLRFAPNTVKPDSAEPKTGTKQPKKPRNLPEAISGGALMEMEFDTFRLEGELGRFMGELERDMMAVALTGDSGAGKSTFSFSLARLFLQAGFKVCYFSLEMGISKRTQQMMQENDYQDLILYRKGKLPEVKKATKEFDVIFVDSFSRLECKADDFEDLRQTYPDTIFVVIFQKTNQGTIRGGASIKYNSTATIDIQLREDGERVAVMEKSRYGTQDWEYLVTEQRIAAPIL